MVSRQTLWARKRSADPEYRKRRRAYDRAYWAAHKDEYNARQREKYQAGPGHNIERRYGISRSEYNALFERQGGVCAICKKKSKRRLAVDHCHFCNTVRGLLCHKCNTGLGLFDDDPDRLRAAAAYLERSRRQPISDAELKGDNHVAGPPLRCSSPCRPIDEPPTAAPSPAFESFQVAGGEIYPISKQKGVRMTQEETEGLVGAEPPPALDLHVVTDAPCIAPEQDGGAAATARAHDALAGAEFTPLDLAELLKLDIPERGMVLDPIIPEKGLALLYAMRGTGKTHVALGIAHAVATGAGFLNWQAPKPRRVLLVDGEMPTSDLRGRLRSVVAGTGVAAAPGMLKVLAGDLRDDGIGNLARLEVQRKLERCLDGVELLILDNLASLLAGQHENDADSWMAVQQWLLRLRRRGISVVVVHHAGKNGEQRGISNREDLLDTSISLRRPSDYSPAEGARFEVHVAKGRGLRGAPALPFEASLATEADKAVWTVKPIEDVESARVEALLADGMSIRDIAEETGIARSTVHRLKKKLERDTKTGPDGTG
jgi:hypothetical protein